MTRIDHVAEANIWIKNAIEAQASRTPNNEQLATAYGAMAQATATLALVEQQRIANLIALAKTAQEYYGPYAGEAGFAGTLFDNPKTELGNMRLKQNIAAALGLTAEQGGGER